MITIIAVFYDKTGAMKFYSFLKKYKFNANIVNTPKELGSICGISIEFKEKDFRTIKNNFNIFEYKTFKNFFKKIIRNGRIAYEIIR